MLPVNDGLVPVTTVLLEVEGTVGIVEPKDEDILLPAPSSNLTSAAWLNAK